MVEVDELVTEADQPGTVKNESCANSRRVLWIFMMEQKTRVWSKG